MQAEILVGLARRMRSVICSSCLDRTLPQMRPVLWEELLMQDQKLENRMLDHTVEIRQQTS